MFTIPTKTKATIFSDVLSTLVREPELLPPGFLEIEITVEAGGDDKEVAQWCFGDPHMQEPRVS
jgi:hypothetical protein